MSWGAVAAAAIGVGGSMLLDRGGGGGGGTEVQQQSTMSPQQQVMMNQLLSLTSGQFPPSGTSPGTPFSDPFQFQGNRVAGLGQLTQQGLGAAGALGQQGQQTIGNLLNPQSGGALDAIFGRGNVEFGRASEQIANKFGAMNSTSSSGARDAQLRALEQFTLGSQAQAIPAFLQSQGMGLNAIPQLQQGLFQGGGIQQGQNQAQINEQIAAAQRQNPLNSRAFSAGSTLAGFPSVENIGIQQPPSMLGTFAGGLLGGAGDAIGNGLPDILGGLFKKGG